jgi:cell division septal protein FtsQ
MTLRIRWPFAVMGIILLLAAGAVGAAIYTDFFALKKVVIEPESYSAELSQLNIPIGQNIFAVPVEDAITYLIHKPMVFKVTAEYELPGQITFHINDFKPVALALGEDGRCILGIDDRYRFMPYDKSKAGVGLPLITGLKNCALYQKVKDYRVGLILTQLNRLKQEQSDLYQSVSAIDLSTTDSITVYLDGLRCPIVMYAGGIFEGIRNLKQFLVDFNPELQEILRIDLKSENQIIATRKQCQKKG